MKPIRYPVRALRSWEGFYYPEPDEDMTERLAEPFTRIEDADGETIVTAHDLFEFRPGQAERIVACLNACDGSSTEALQAVARTPYATREIALANVMTQRDELLSALRSVEQLLQRMYESPSMTGTRGAALIDAEMPAIRAAIAKIPPPTP